MELIVLGSGAFAPPPAGSASAVRNPSGYAVRLGRETLLFDLGFGNLRQLVKAGVDPSSVAHVFITHRHLDHLGDLAALLFHFRYESKPEGGRLNLYGPPGFRRFLADLKRAHRPWLGAKGYRSAVRELRPGDLVRGEGWKVEGEFTPHFTVNLAYRLAAEGKSLVYSGDTGPGGRLAAFAAGCDLLLLECAQPSSRPLSGHLTPPQALSLIQASGCRRALVTHVSAASEKELQRLLARRRGRRPRVSIARDLQRVRV